MPQDATSTPTELSGPVLSGSFSAYDILDRVGSGGMGVVYRGTDRRLRRTVALKFLSGVDSSDAEARERLLREARAASALDHPNIGTIYGIEEGADGTLCIVMAFYDGETVATRVAREVIPPAEAAAIAAQVALGLAEAHANGVIHRDIKPSNILLTRSGGVKIVDFGVARFTAGDQTVTQPATVAGTVSYMSPEQARGEAMDARSDIWSLGVVLYEMLTGVRAFPGRDVLAQLYAVVNHTPDFDLIPEAALRRIVQRALARDPGRRYGTAAEMAADLQRATGAESRIPAASPNRKVGRRAGLIAGIALLAGVAATVAVRQPWTSKQPVVVAFLPFSNNQDPATAALATGLAGSLSDRIARLERFSGALTVVPASDVMGRNIRTPAEALRQIRATAAVSGALERGASGRLTLVLQLNEGAGAQPVTFHGSDIRELEQTTAMWLANALEIRADSAWPAAETQNASSYEAWLRGLGYLQRWDKPENLDDAIAAFGEAIRADSRFAPAYVGMAEASRTRFRAAVDPASLQHALNYAQQAVRLNETSPQAHVVLGRIYHDTAQRDLAVIEFRRALELDPKDMSALGGMARTYEDLGRFSEAEAAMRRVVAARPYAWTAPNTLGGFYMRRARYADAEGAFRSTLRLTPDNAAVLSNLGVSLLRQRRYPEAIEIFRRSIEIAPTYAAQLNLAIAHYRRREFRLAATHCERALQLNNRDFRTWGTYAQALRLTGATGSTARTAYASAIRLAEESRKTNPGQPRTLTLLAMYYASTGNRTQAMRSLEAGLASAGSDRDALVDAALAYELTGQRQKAAQWAQRALEAGVPWQDLREDPDFDNLIGSGSIKPVREVDKP